MARLERWARRHPMDHSAAADPPRGPVAVLSADWLRTAVRSHSLSHSNHAQTHTSIQTSQHRHTDGHLAPAHSSTRPHVPRRSGCEFLRRRFVRLRGAALPTADVPALLPRKGTTRAAVAGAASGCVILCLTAVPQQTQQSVAPRQSRPVAHNMIAHMIMSAAAAAKQPDAQNATLSVSQSSANVPAPELSVAADPVGGSPGRRSTRCSGRS